MRKLNSKNFNEQIMHHIMQALCLATQLHQRYSVPVTEPLDYKEAMEFASLLQQAYRGELEPVPINPFLREEFHEKKLPEGKRLKQYFPFTLTQVMNGIKQPELEPGKAPHVVICEKTLVVSVTTQRISKDIEKLLDNRSNTSSILKALEKNPLDGFSPRLNIRK